MWKVRRKLGIGWCYDGPRTYHVRTCQGRSPEKTRFNFSPGPSSPTPFGRCRDMRTNFWLFSSQIWQVDMNGDTFSTKALKECSKKFAATLKGNSLPEDMFLEYSFVVRWSWSASIEKVSPLKFLESNLTGEAPKQSGKTNVISNSAIGCLHLILFF